jgi:DNA-directed RNA polymerase subunit RPC12/RpoP
MQTSHIAQSQHVIEHPKCAKCGVPMWLTRIEPSDEEGKDRRTFECQACGHNRIEIVQFG